PAQTAKYFDPNLTYTPRVGEEDVETVVLRGESDTAVETVTYYFVNNVYSRQETVTEYATEEGAKNAYPQISHHEDAKIEGNTVSFKFVSYAFQEMSRDEVRNYWQDLFDSAPEFYANYSISIVDKAE
ncbi:MAG: hypothetical protein IJO48_04840, partial [Clostridia bacterium]|nr:hypothetical protein [Clostridia bacterium]